MGIAILLRKPVSFANNTAGKVSLKDEPLQKIEIVGSDSIQKEGVYSIQFYPSSTNRRDIDWFISQGASIANIDQYGNVTATGGSGTITIKAVSSNDPSIYATKSVQVGGVNINFADNNVKAICVSNWGSDGELTYEQAAAVTSLGGVFTGNTTITSFDELRFFKNCKSTLRDFKNCSNLTSIKLPASYLLNKNEIFAGCSKLENFSLELDYNGIIANRCFYNCVKLHIDTIPKGVTQIQEGAFYQNTTVSKIKFVSYTPPSLENKNALCTTGYGSVLAKIYVPDIAYNDYKTAPVWSEVYSAGKLYKISEW